MRKIFLEPGVVFGSKSALANDP